MFVSTFTHVVVACSTCRVVVCTVVCVEGAWAMLEDLVVQISFPSSLTFQTTRRTTLQSSIFRHFSGVVHHVIRVTAAV